MQINELEVGKVYYHFDGSYFMHHRPVVVIEITDDGRFVEVVYRYFFGLRCNTDKVMRWYDKQRDKRYDQVWELL